MRQVDELERIREHARAWEVDYSAARAKALAWLGNRYLLAQPVRRKTPPDQAPARGQLSAADRHLRAA